MTRLLLALSLLPSIALGAPPFNVCANDTCPTIGQKTGAASLPVVLPSDTTAKVEGLDAAAATTTTAPVRIGAQAEDDSAAMTSTGVADQEAVNLKATPEGRLYVQTGHPNRFRCTVTVSTATTLTAVGGSCAAPGAGLSLYVTDIKFDASAAGIGADAHPTLKYGTGGTCGTGTAVFWQSLTAAAVQAVQSFDTPIKIPANNEICWISSTAGSKALVLTGYIAP